MQQPIKPNKAPSPSANIFSPPGTAKTRKASNVQIPCELYSLLTLCTMAHKRDLVINLNFNSCVSDVVMRHRIVKGSTI